MERPPRAKGTSAPRAAPTRTAPRSVGGRSTASRDPPLKPLSEVTVAPPRGPIAFDPGYAQALGGPVPVVVHAKASWSRPGTVTAAAVIALIVAGFCAVAGAFWLVFARVGADFDATSQKHVAFAAVNLVLAVAFILGGVAVLSRQPWGRFLLMGAGALHVVYAVARILDSLWAVGIIVFACTGVLIVALLATPPATRYFASRSPLGYE